MCTKYDEYELSGKVLVRGHDMYYGDGIIHTSQAKWITDTH